MSGTSPRDLGIVDHRVMTTAVGGGPSVENNVCNTPRHQSLYTTYGKIHIKDKNLIRLEIAPEHIYRENGIGPLSVWAESEG